MIEVKINELTESQAEKLRKLNPKINKGLLALFSVVALSLFSIVLWEAGLSEKAAWTIEGIFWVIVALIFLWPRKRG